MDFELNKWGDGTLRLSFWDYRQGYDKHFIIGDDGQAYVEEEDDSRTPVNLIVELRNMANGAGLLD